MTFMVFLYIHGPIRASLLSQKSLDGSFPFPCPGLDPGNVLYHDRLRWAFGVLSGTGTGTGTGTDSEAFLGLRPLVGRRHNIVEQNSAITS